MFSSKPSKIGVIGLGIVGSRISEVLRKSGLHVYVWNRSPKQLPNFTSSPAEVARLAQVVQLFVRNGKDVLEVIEPSHHLCFAYRWYGEDEPTKVVSQRQFHRLSRTRAIRQRRRYMMAVIRRAVAQYFGVDFGGSGFGSFVFFLLEVALPEQSYGCTGGLPIFDLST